MNKYNNIFLSIIIIIFVLIIILYFSKLSIMNNEGFNNWKNKRFFKRRYMDNNQDGYVATAPVHSTEGFNNWKNKRFFKRRYMDNNQDGYVATAPVHYSKGVDNNIKEDFLGSTWFFNNKDTKNEDKESNEGKEEPLQIKDNHIKLKKLKAFPDFSKPDDSIYIPKNTNHLPELNNKVLMNANGINNNFDKNNIINKQFKNYSNINTVPTPIKNIPLLNTIPQASGPYNLEKKNINPILKENCFKFIGENENIDVDNYLFTGAEMGVDNNSSFGINCNGNSQNETAQAIASVNDGKIIEIHIINNGKGYLKNPKITITSAEGYGCKAESLINDNGNLEIISIKNEGEGYINTPKITIESPK